MKLNTHLSIILLVSLFWACKQQTDKKDLETSTKKEIQLTAKDILGNPDYLAISYGGYRKSSRDIQPTINELKEDMKILHAMGIRILRTYNVQLAQASNLLQAIKEMKQADSSFEMYVMLGAWIDCKNAWTGQEPNHELESEQNVDEIGRAVALANKYPEIVKILAVGNEAMVKWATSYYVQPRVILKWVNYLQDLKKNSKLPKDLWITSSDDFASWGGGDSLYHTQDLEDLIKSVDYVSMHTYPFHNSHYNPSFWKTPKEKEALSGVEKVEFAMKSAVKFAWNQYKAVSSYVKSIDSTKTIHIGETGWATVSNGFYGSNGSKAADEFKAALYYKYLREWTNKEGISCFYFEAFDEPWKDAANKKGSENHFGLFKVDGTAKYAMWNAVDEGVFKGLTRNGKPIKKTYKGNKESLLLEVQLPPVKNENTVKH